MSRGDTGSDIQSLLGQLSEAAGCVDKDDLSRLAKMHGWCESLAEATSTEAERPCATIYEQVVSMTGMLEKIILGEVEDAQAAVSSIIAAISDLCGVSAGADTSDSGAARPEHADPVESAVPAVPAEPVVSAVPVEPSGSDDGEPAYESIPLKIDDKELEFVKGFVEEASEHLEAIETAVLEVERDPTNAEKINDLFRPFHTIKGMAGFLNLRDVNCLTHEVETLLDQGRKGQRPITPGVIDLVLSVEDILKVQVSSIGAYVANPNGGVIPQPSVTEMIGTLRAVVAGRREADVQQAGPANSAPRQANKPQGKVAESVQATPSPATPSPATVLQAAPPSQATAPARPQAAGGSTEAPKSTSGAVGQPVGGDQSIRIDTNKLDALVEMVGELVIAQTQVGANGQISADPKLTKDVGQVTKIVRDVQELAMSMRMVPIGSTFQKMYRLVRDLSRKAGKNVELVISGEETELDKNVIQQIGDPLVHMIRNALDHGIESPEVRRQAGKDEVGHVYLSAFHQGGNIVIEIRDDGKGLDPAVLIAKGIEKGIVQPGEELTDQQAFALIFAPGFSTAAQVTEISGRGVGMDVVKRNIDQLRGKVEIASEKGVGSTFSIRLPLTLAIIDGMLVRIGGERFIIPTTMIQQSLRPRPEQITTVQQKGELLQVRGQLIPLIQLGRLFGLTGRVDPCEAMVVVAHSDGRFVGLVVEELIAQQQVVIKSLGERFEGLKGISGGAILGDGHVGLILETAGLVELANRRIPAGGLSETQIRNCPSGGQRAGREVAQEQDVTVEDAHASPAVSLT